MELNFRSHSTAEKKTFTIEFPYDSVFSMRWDKKEQEKLRKYNDSSLVSDKLKMLAMMAEKVEAHSESAETVES